MRIDVSEVKAFRTCKRQWAFSSRNRLNLAPRVQPKALTFGTHFHECLHGLYTGATWEKIERYIDQNLEAQEDRKLLKNMISEYMKEVLPQDLEDYEVLDIEYRFSMDTPQLTKWIDLQLCGSIDMIVRRKTDNTIWGFEHKSAKTFKSDFMVGMDEQPALYTIALQEYIKERHPECTLGGIFFNEVKKLYTQFEWKRTACTYTEDYLRNFLLSFLTSCHEIIIMSSFDKLPSPSPNVMNCKLCTFANDCVYFGYSDPQDYQVKDFMKEEFQVKEVDHLDEKSTRGIE